METTKTMDISPSSGVKKGEIVKLSGSKTQYYGDILVEESADGLYKVVKIESDTQIEVKKLNWFQEAIYYTVKFFKDLVI